MNGRPRARSNTAPDRWTIGLARKNFSDVLKAAERGPQEIYNRKRLAAVVVPPSMLPGFAGPAMPPRPRTIYEIFAPAREIAGRTGWTLPVTRRTNRPNAFLKLLNQRAR